MILTADEGTQQHCNEKFSEKDDRVLSEFEAESVSFSNNFFRNGKTLLTVLC
jgi:hypothetical protein